MAEISDAEAKNYVVARFAEWAGDLAYSRSLYAEFGVNKKYAQIPDRFDDPVDVIGFVSTLRAVRLGEPTHEETRRLAFDVFSPEIEETTKSAPEPLLLQPTLNLRAVVHRTGVRDFEMRGYLINPEYESQLYSSATKLGAQTEEDRDDSAGKSAYASPGGEWVVEGVLFQQVTVSDFGLIKSMGRWTKTELPSNVDEISGPFQQLLESLDRRL
ncbi:hypothetical protein [Schlesneria sp. DSM 10557]|uniref:hypothetical protein n=1 Tax=Schlesneria sp. DSM 10557 TaxID=3044399 RepID=UPI00359F3A55